MINERIKAILSDAAEIVSAVDLPHEYREVAFSRTIDLLVGDSEPSSSYGPHAQAVGSETPAPSWMAALEADTGRTRLELDELLFEDDDGDPLVGVNPTRLGDNAAERSRRVILLLAGTRQVGGIEEGTRSNILRDECKRLGVYDSSNFGTTLNNLKDWFNITGTGGSKVARIKPGGRDAFRQLIGDLLGDGHS